MFRQHLVLKIIVLVVSLFYLEGCGSQPKYQLHTLPNGKQIKLMGIGKIHFSKDNPGLILTYQTDIPIIDSNAIKNEVDCLWKFFRVDVDKSGLSQGFISVYEPLGGGQGRLHNFGYKKDSLGQWKAMSKARF